jgi:hypothetical protein
LSGRSAIRWIEALIAASADRTGSGGRATAMDETASEAAVIRETATKKRDLTIGPDHSQVTEISNPRVAISAFFGNREHREANRDTPASRPAMARHVG